MTTSVISNYTPISVKDPFFGAVGDGLADDTVAIQNAINYLGQLNSGRGGTVFLPSGLYKITSPLQITSQGNLRILGASPCADQVANNAVSSTLYQYGASSLVYSGSAGTACFQVAAAGPLSGWATIGIVFEDISIVTATSTTDGVLLSGGDNDVGSFQYDIYFKGCFIGGGRYGVHMTGNNTFNVFIDGLEINVYQSLQPSWGIYSELTNGPGIACSWKNLRIVHTSIGHIYLEGVAFQIVLDSCTFEACGKSSIVAPNSVGQLSFLNCHWEQIGSSAYWNGSTYQYSNSDATPVAPILLGSVAAGNTTSSVEINGCSINTKVLGGTGVYKVLPIIVSYDSSVISINGGHIGPIGLGLNQGQPYFVRNSNEARINLDRVICEPMQSGVLPVGGSQTVGGLRLIHINNCDGLLAYPVTQPTNGSADYNSNEFSGLHTDLIRLQGVQPTGAAISLLTTRREMTIPDVSWLTTANIAEFGPFNKGDILWTNSGASYGQPLAFVCMANSVVTFTQNQWHAILPGPIAEQSLLPAYSTSMTPDMTWGNWFPILVTDNVNFAINAPLNGGIGGMILEVTILNISGGALGTATWNAAFRMTAWNQPANGFSRSIRFRHFASNWIEVSRTAADVNN